MKPLQKLKIQQGVAVVMKQWDKVIQLVEQIEDEEFRLHPWWGPDKDDDVKPLKNPLETMGPYKFEDVFKISKVNFNLVCDLLQVPEVFKLENRRKVDGRVAILICLARLIQAPRCLSELRQHFDSERTHLSRCYNKALEWMCEKWADKMLRNLKAWGPHMEAFNDAINWEGAEVTSVLGIDDYTYPSRCALLVDGTHIQICKPTHTKEGVYSGHKKCDVFNTHFLIAPNGLAVQVPKVFAGPVNDARIWSESGVEKDLETIGDKLLGWYPCVIGDPAYTCSAFLMSGYKRKRGQELTRDQESFNNITSKLRIPVEWSFATLKHRLFRCTDNKTQWKLEQMAIGLAVDFMACWHNLILLCCGKSTQSEYYHIRMPTLQEYFDIINNN